VTGYIDEVIFLIIQLAQLFILRIDDVVLLSDIAVLAFQLLV